MPSESVVSASYQVVEPSPSHVALRETVTGILSQIPLVVAVNITLSILPLG